MINAIALNLNSDISCHLAHSCHRSDSRRDMCKDLLDLCFVVPDEEDVVYVDDNNYDFAGV